MNNSMIKLFVLNVHFHEEFNHVINLSMKTIFKKEEDINHIRFNELDVIERIGTQLRLKGYYTTQKLCDTMYLSFVNSDDFDLSMSANEKKNYEIVLERAYAEYPEILI
jgi:hypothetical protein